MMNDTNDQDIQQEAEEKTDAAPKPVFVEAVRESEQEKGLEDLWSILRENNSVLTEIKTAVQARSEYDAAKEKAFDKLYEDMRQQREIPNLLDRNVKPLLTDLLLLYDNMKNFATYLINQKATKNINIYEKFKYIIDDLLEALYRQEVVLIENNGSEKFNSKIQKATKIEIATTQEEDFTIVNVTREGFLWRDKVLRPQEVVMRRFENKR
jgi:molecular chaperone GrpE